MGVYMDCLFCKLNQGEIPSYTIYEDNIVKAFLDINPDSDGHTLLIPKKHYTNIEDIDEYTLNHLNNIAKKIYFKLKASLDFDGLSFVQNNKMGQQIKHYHLHLIPKYKENKDYSNNKNALTPVEEIYNLIK